MSWQRRLLGLKQRAKQDFEVLLARDGDTEARALEAPRLRYWADPFLVPHNSRLWLFCEEFDFLENRGRVVALRLDAGLAVAERTVALDIPEHLSYPNVFEHAGRLFLLPECFESRRVDLYECESFPDRWVRRRCLVEGADAVDPTLHFEDGRVWLFTSIQERGRPGRGLALFSSPSLLDGRFEPHPVNPRRLYSEWRRGTGRCAGPIHREGEALVRPIQDNPRFYAQGLRFMRIAELTPTGYHEEPLADPHPAAALVARYGSHHLSRAAGVVAIDRRRRWSYIDGWPLVGRFGRPAGR